MNKISSKEDEVYIYKKFLSDNECDKYYKMIKDIGYRPMMLPWSERSVDITDDPIVDKVTKYLNKRFKLKLKVDQVQLQNHHINSFCKLHIHKNDRKKIKYNSLIYLNDNFLGGNFLTSNGIEIKPEKGMLTFFNGQTVYHGVKTILENDRKTIIFWWKE